MADHDHVEGKAKGGMARAENLSPERRKEIAQKAAEARWRPDRAGIVKKATHRGELHLGDITLECAVLGDGTRVIWQRALYQAIGMARTTGGPQGGVGAHVLPRFVSSSNLTPYISEGLRCAANPLQFVPIHGGRTAYGYRAEILPEICNVYLSAKKDNKLKRFQEKIANQCEILLRGLSKVGIIALVDEATGYQEIRPKDALQEYLRLIVRQDLAAWAKKFPDEFYENIYKLNGWPWPGMKKNRYSIVAQFTRDLVYERLAPGLLEELEKKAPRDEKGNRPAKLHQWLTEDIGDPMLAQHIYSLIMFQRLALSNGFGMKRFVKMVDRVHPKKGSTLELPFPIDGIDPIEP